MKFLNLFSIILFTILTIALFPKQSFAQVSSQSSIAQAKILGIQGTSQINPDTKKEVRNIVLKILSGNLSGKTFTIQDNIVAMPYEIHYSVGDVVIVTTTKGPNGQDVVYISDVDRQPMLIVLAIILVILTIVVARWQGIASLLGMLVSFYVIAAIIIPNIVAGTNPLVITFIGSGIIIPCTYYLAHGLNRKTTIAILGTVCTLLLSGLLAYGFTMLTKLSGFASEESVYIQNISSNTIDMKNLLLAGMLIGALAVLNDITISQSSIVESLYKANNTLSFSQLFSHAMSVGRDHVASLINTLILVYVGASFPLVILFYNAPVSLGLIVNQEIIATEIVRTIVSSIGIIAAVPITTYLACLAAHKKI